MNNVTPAPGMIMIPTVALDCLLSNESGLPFEQRVSSFALGWDLIDTEGHELESLRGAIKLIEKGYPWLIVEFNTELLSSVVLEDWSYWPHRLALHHLVSVLARPAAGARRDVSRPVADLAEARKA